MTAMARFTATAQAPLDLDWFEAWAKRVNDDRVMRVVGRFFTVNFVIGIDDTDYLIVMREGRVQRVSEGLDTNMMGWQFALRAPRGSWSKFAQPTPPAMFHDIWAMAHPLHGKLKIEGDTKPFWQNLRALTWSLDLMRLV
jgi:hypothetical protein